MRGGCAGSGETLFLFLFYSWVRFGVFYMFEGDVCTFVCDGRMDSSGRGERGLDASRGQVIPFSFDYISRGLSANGEICCAAF